MNLFDQQRRNWSMISLNLWTFLIIRDKTGAWFLYIYEPFWSAEKKSEQCCLFCRLVIIVLNYLKLQKTRLTLKSKNGFYNLGGKDLKSKNGFYNLGGKDLKSKNGFYNLGGKDLKSKNGFYNLGGKDLAHNNFSWLVDFHVSLVDWWKISNFYRPGSPVYNAENFLLLEHADQPCSSTDLLNFLQYMWWTWRDHGTEQEHPAHKIQVKPPSSMVTRWTGDCYM